ncbi:MAG: peptidoglycan DD-metalloendopeptidase family protein [Rhodocyclaceae bacterium]
MVNTIRTAGWILAALVVAACASSAPKAPVESRAPGGVATAPVAPLPAPVARPGYHIVKKGETLYSIALEYGQSYRDVATWNNLVNPGVIEIGQELRVQPPEGSAVGVVQSPVIEVRPLDGMPPPASGSAPIASAPVQGDASTKSEPRGGRVAYSAEAWAAVQNGAKPQAAPAPIAPPHAAVPTPIPAPTASEPVSTAPKGDGAAAVSEDGLNWMWPTNGKVVAAFSDATNKGVDIGGTAGQPVVAAEAGRVVYVGSGLRGYGNLVIIKHNDTFLSAYAHNKEVLVKEGQAIQKGQKVATMGDSDADRVKLHFEIRRQGKPVDPTKYLPTR